MVPTSFVAVCIVVCASLLVVQQAGLPRNRPHSQQSGVSRPGSPKRVQLAAPEQEGRLVGAMN